jgi:hydroxymethylpyrimidine/phosphomethylpyrimidine kinase
MIRQQGHVVRALTVAGSDSGGGAGIQADLKTFAAFEVYGASVITALTAQNTLGVQGVLATDPAFVRLQLDSVLSDIGADAVKTGMLANAAVIEAVAEGFTTYGVRYLVVDPVMVAKGGEPLLEPEAAEALRTRLLPLADVVTPNIPEAAALWGRPIESWADAQAAAEAILSLGPKAVVIKGGHAQAGWGPLLPGWEATAWSVDMLYDGTSWTWFAAPRVPSRKTHGTGCTFSAAVAAALARLQAEKTRVPGENGAADDGARKAVLARAVASAKAFVHAAIESAADWDVGAGHGPTDHSVPAVLAEGVAPGGRYRWVDGTWRADAEGGR